MPTGEETLKLLLTLVGIAIVVYLAHTFLWAAVLLLVATIVLPILEHVVNGRSRP